jgi:hypothetical protein
VQANIPVHSMNTQYSTKYARATFAQDMHVINAMSSPSRNNGSYIKQRYKTNKGPPAHVSTRLGVRSLQSTVFTNVANFEVLMAKAITRNRRHTDLPAESHAGRCKGEAKAQVTAAFPDNECYNLHKATCQPKQRQQRRQRSTKPKQDRKHEGAQSNDHGLAEATHNRTCLQHLASMPSIPMAKTDD